MPHIPPSLCPENDVGYFLGWSRSYYGSTTIGTSVFSESIILLQRNSGFKYSLKEGHIEIK